MGAASRVVDWFTAGQVPQPVGMSAGIAGCTSGPMLKYISMPAFIWYSCMYALQYITLKTGHRARDHIITQSTRESRSRSPCGSGKAIHLQPIIVSYNFILAHMWWSGEHDIQRVTRAVSSSPGLAKCTRMTVQECAGTMAVSVT